MHRARRHCPAIGRLVVRSHALPKMSGKEAAATEKMCTSFGDSMHSLANEPSLGLYYVCEHIQRTVPTLVSSKHELLREQQNKRKKMQCIDRSLSCRGEKEVSRQLCNSTTYTSAGWLAG